MRRLFGVLALFGTFGVGAAAADTTLPRMIVVRTDFDANGQEINPVVLTSNFDQKVVDEASAIAANAAAESGCDQVPLGDNVPNKPPGMQLLLAAVGRFAQVNGESATPASGKSSAARPLIVAGWTHAAVYAGGYYGYGFGHGAAYGYGRVVEPLVLKASPQVLVNARLGYHPYVGHFGFEADGALHPFGYWGYSYQTPSNNYYYYYNPAYDW
jgi:hypothetical protein